MQCKQAGDCAALPVCASTPSACTCDNGTCKHDSGSSTTISGCRECHGGPDNPAPPQSISGATDTVDVGVGAHQAHLVPGELARPVVCSACHTVPHDLDESGHVDSASPAEVIFGALATGSGTLTQATWDRDTGTCVTYCHGATLLGGTNTAPIWTLVDGSQTTCSACHGLPPAGDHPQSSQCEYCHAPTAGPDFTIAHSSTHIDGVVQTGGNACDSCHGGGGRAAPPSAVHGETATTDVEVGAHAVHLENGLVRRAIECSECHVVPATVDAPGHIGGTDPRVTFGSLARTGGAAPSWNRNDATCSNTYCHGSFDGGNQSNTPVWTLVDGTQSACDVCHGNPPAAPHPPTTDCTTCHSATITAWGAIDVQGGHHIDGVVDVADMECTSCHGDPSTNDSAPPLGVHGETSTTARGVGSHRAHLDDSSWHAAVRCVHCHVVPTDPEHSDGVTQLDFSAVSAADGAHPVYNTTTGTCSNVYCHGTTLQGANQGSDVRTPVWTQVDGTNSYCGRACHTNPPGSPHVPLGQCSDCHGSVVDAAGNVMRAELHINGVVEVTLPSCDACHGTPLNSAPPPSTTGSTNTHDVAVGAHASHLRSGDYASAVACEECHVVPAVATDPGHIDPSPAEVVFGALSKTSGAQPTWNHGTAQCSNNYCHGATLTGGTNTTPTWTAVGAGQVSCESCHGNPPPSPHSTSTACHDCHADTVDTSNAIVVAGGFHMDGKVDATGQTCSSCHGDVASDSPAPPRSVAGDTLTTVPGVGAHAIHLADSSWHRPGQCVDCHPVPTSVDHANDVTDLVWTGVSRADGSTPAYTAAHTCTGSYCHGATLEPDKSGSTSSRAPLWTQVNGMFGRCGSACHTNPPGGTHVDNTQCSGCHGAVVNASGTIINAALHINGVVEISEAACDSCHGGSGNPAPPTTSTGAASTTDIGVGAHQAHLAAGVLALATACEECHQVPATVAAPLHLDRAPAEVTFGVLSRADGATPTWNHGTATCAGSYCHGATLGGGTNKAPVWTRVDGTQDRCGTCHGQPPPRPHSQLNECSGCHPDTVDDNGDILVAGGRHINGIVEEQPVHPQPEWSTEGSANFHGVAANAGFAGCQSCHGALLDGGGSGVACTQCHDSNWTTNCAYCHGSGDSTSGAPPTDVGGLSATTAVTVGAHTSHVSATHAIAAAQPCSACHMVPSDALSTSHVDASPAEVVFGALAKTAGVSPTWNRTTAGCANSYCHGNFTGGVTTNVASWTQVNGSEVACAACHPTPPSSGDHRRTDHRSAGCDACHSGIVNPAGTAIVNPSLHVNGSKNVVLKRGGTWSASARTCDPSCHGSERW